MAGLAAAASLVVLAQAQVDRRASAPAELRSATWRADELARLAPGFELVLADVYWLRAVQYFGHQRAFAADKRYDLLAPMLNVVTTLDPRMDIAFEYGATFLCEPAPAGANQPHLGVALLRRGVARHPQNWRLRQQLGLFLSVFLDDHVAASRELAAAAELPGAAFWLKSLAADILSRGGERGASRMAWEAIYSQSSDVQIRSNAETHLRVLDGLDGAEALERQVQALVQRGRPRPTSIEELARSLGLPASRLVDPSGTPYRYQPVDGAVLVAHNSPLWREKFVGKGAEAPSHQSPLLP